MNQESSNRAEEQQRVDDVIHEIDKKEEKLYSKSSGLKESVIELRKSFWDDVTVNLDEPDDVIETQASIKQQAELLSERERTHGKIGEELNTLKKLKDSPYFGRIDFIEDPGREKEKVYIGISSLMDYDEENFLVYDWRAPISSLYYDYPPGKADYKTIEGTITGEISLKRQFIIRQGLIKGMFDTGVTIGDTLLQQALGNNASTTMKSIVATIQREQNKIIRNERSDLLIVQGVAGSGKTSAALQRIAYLLYRYREELHAENVVLFSPNPLFTSYIANVLPELGETNVRQTTFLDFLEAGIGEDFTIESPFEQMEYVLTELEREGYPIRMDSMDYKSSVDFKYMIDEFVSHLEDGGIRFKSITFRKRILISKEQISDYFYSLDNDISIPNKMEFVRKWLLKEIAVHQKKEKNKDWVMDQVELLAKEDYLKAYYKDQEYDVNDSGLEEKILRTEVVKRVFSKIKKRVKRLEFVNVTGTYRNLFSEWTPEEKPKHWKEICEQTAADLTRKFLTWEDATPYLYFKDSILGGHADRAVRHLFIDEAQDYSAFQFAYIKGIFPYTRMTLLGDINQAIYANTTKENPLIPEEIQRDHERITLTKSYRSTKQIVEFTKYFAPGKEMIEPFDREGSKPQLVRVENKEKLSKTLVEYVIKLREKGHETIAIICKTLQESERLYHLLQNKVSVRQIDEETYAFEKGLLVLPVYLAKGIEFDAVIIPDASRSHYAMESDRTLFYTACTRAMHDLIMVTGDEPCTFIGEVQEDKYKVI
ncbi:RNA polymerase recycling motor HelD [Virgibacillus ndiopensis]|uniref:RNA polymerase recycling motor HelD n=1 Tax=Virgibacillus ndiopensis TaxID=2004408 RepID=UPI000C07809C|nr:RNA polymerase recycling motor HelD [Virgibacillus ndiopensis]